MSGIKAAAYLKLNFPQCQRVILLNPFFRRANLCGFNYFACGGSYYSYHIITVINSVQLGDAFLYPLKTSENL